MSRSHWMIASLAASSMLAAAQDKPRDPANPAEVVSAPIYQSAFSGYQAATDNKKSPVELWRAVNDEMARLGGHMGQLKASPDARESMPAHPPLPHKSEGK